MKTKWFGQLCAAAAAVVIVVTTAGAQSSGPVDPSEQKHAERLGVEAKELDAKAGKAAATPAGERRVTDAIAKDYKVDPSVVTDLRNRKMGYGEITIALALSQELIRETKLWASSKRSIRFLLSARLAKAGARSLTICISNLGTCGARSRRPRNRWPA